MVDSSDENNVLTEIEFTYFLLGSNAMYY